MVKHVDGTTPGRDDEQSTNEALPTATVDAGGEVRGVWVGNPPRNDDVDQLAADNEERRIIQQQQEHDVGTHKNAVANVTRVLAAEPDHFSGLMHTRSLASPVPLISKDAFGRREGNGKEERGAGVDNGDVVRGARLGFSRVSSEGEGGGWRDGKTEEREKQRSGIGMRGQGGSVGVREQTTQGTAAVIIAATKSAAAFADSTPVCLLCCMHLFTSARILAAVTAFCLFKCLSL